MKQLLYAPVALLCVAASLLGQQGQISGGITQPGAAQRSAANPTTLPCTVGQSPALVYNDAGTDSIYTAQGSPCAYAIAPGGSTSTLTASGVGASGAAGANKLTGPPNGIVGTDSSGKGNIATPDVGYQSAFTNNVLNHGNATTNSIASTISFCSTNSCSILIPPTYPTTEVVPGTYYTQFGFPDLGAPYGNPRTGSSTAGTVSITDQRFGDWESFTNFFGANNIGLPKLWNFNWSQRPPVTFAHNRGLAIVGSAYDGGSNFNNGTLVNKATFEPFIVNLNSATLGQLLAISSSIHQYGIGDAEGLGTQVTAFGGAQSQSDEGTEWGDLSLLEGYVEYAGPVVGTPSAGATSVTVAPTQGSGTQGAGRYLIDTTTGTISAGTISAISSPGGAPTIYTGSGTSWPVSTAIGTLGTTVSVPGSSTVTPTFSTGTISAITTSTLVCIGDGLQWETTIPSAVAGSTFTATFLYAHPSTSIIGVGGLCGKGIELTADQVTNSTYTTKIQTITGTLRVVWPIIYSSSATSATVYVNVIGNLTNLSTAWNSSTANGYVIYPLATVSSVSQNGGISNTLTLTANNMSIAASDVLEEPLYPAVKFSNGQWNMEKYLPSQSLAGGGGIGMFFNGLWTSADSCLGLCVSNNTPLTKYTLGGGAFAPPFSLNFSGQYGYGLKYQYAPDNGGLVLGCLASGCTNPYIVTAMGNGGTQDTLGYNPSTKVWKLTAGGNAASIQQSNTLATISTPTSTPAVQQNQTTPTSGLTLGTTHHSVDCNSNSGSFTVTLPASPTVGEEYVIDNIGSTGTCTVSSNGNYFHFNDVSTITINPQQTLWIIWGGAWFVKFFGQNGLPSSVANCSSNASPAVCGSAAAGQVQVAAAATSIQINTTAVTANSRVGCLTYSTVGITAPANLSSLLTPTLTALTAGTSLTLTLPVAPLTNPVNLQYCLIN